MSKHFVAPERRGSWGRQGGRAGEPAPGRSWFPAVGDAQAQGAKRLLLLRQERGARGPRHRPTRCHLSVRLHTDRGFRITDRGPGSPQTPKKKPVPKWNGPMERGLGAFVSQARSLPKEVRPLPSPTPCFPPPGVSNSSPCPASSPSCMSTCRSRHAAVLRMSHLEVRSLEQGNRIRARGRAHAWVRPRAAMKSRTKRMERQTPKNVGFSTRRKGVRIPALRPPRRDSKAIAEATCLVSEFRARGHRGLPEPLPLQSRSTWASTRISWSP